MNIDEFAKLYLEAIRQAGEKREMVCDHEQSFIKVAGDTGRGMYLGNMCNEYCSSSREEQANVLRRFVRGWFDPQKTIPDEFDDASHDLLPAIRSRFHFESDDLLMQIENKEPPSFPYQPLGDNMAVGLVYDFRDTMRTIRRDDLDRWHMTFQEALEVARRNLRALPYRLEKDNGIYLTVTGDNYDASRLLLLDVIRQSRVKGDFVAMVPNRDTLILTGSNDAKNIKRMVALAKEALELPRPMSGLALRLDGDEWVWWMPDSSHPAYQGFRELEVQTYGRDYNLQKDLLDKLHTARREDVSVAPFRVVQDPATGESLTFCVWENNGKPTLLPRTEGVAFVQEDRVVNAEWDRVIETVGHMMEPLDMYPPRWRVADFPTDTQLATMNYEDMEG